MRRLGLCWVIALVVLSLPASAQSPQSSKWVQPALSVVHEPGPKGRVIASYGRLPLTFEINTGQTDARVKFLSRGAGYALFLTGDEALLALNKPEIRSERSEGTAGSSTLGSTAKSRHSSLVARRSPQTGHRVATTNAGPQATGSVLQMRLVGANTAAIISGVAESPGKSNYFIGNDPSKWRTNIANYARVRYANVYPGVDLVYYGNQGQVEYDFVLASGADPGAIRLSIGGTRPEGGRQLAAGSRKAEPRLTAEGDLVVKIGGGEVRFHKPVVYQPASALDSGARTGRHAVQGRYRLTHGNVTFEVGSYDHARPLVIDPALSYSTFLEGTGVTQANGITVDASGNAYVTGNTQAADFPTTSGAFQRVYGGTGTGDVLGDAFVTKFNPTGSTLVYSTYVGGSGGDSGAAIALDASGDTFITGTTNSTNFPVTPGAFQTTCGDCNAEAGGLGTSFVTELNSDGSALMYSTYLGSNSNSGGTTFDEGGGIAVDSSGSAYVAGITDGKFPTTYGAFDLCAPLGSPFLYLTKLNPSGSALVYSDCILQAFPAYLPAIAVDGSGSAYLAGGTSDGYQVTQGAFQTTFGGGTYDGFVTKFAPSGETLVYSTYLGGINADFVSGITVDSSGGAHVTGFTYSYNFPTTAGAFDTICNACPSSSYDGFVAELNPAGSALVYSTFLGGSVHDQGSAIAVDPSGNAYVTGRTASLDFPTTAGAFSTQFGGGSSDAIFTELNPTGTALVYSTYLGGTQTDQGNAIALDSSANAYLAGYTESLNFPVTPGAFDTSCQDCSEGNVAFVTKFAPGDQVWPLTLNFGNEDLGSTTAPQVTTLSNSNTAALNITGITITGANGADFIETNTCGSSLSPGASCQISVTFAPLALGAQSAVLEITDDAPNSPQTVLLSGTGVQPAVTFSPQGLIFSPQLVYTSSAPQTATLTNAGQGSLLISSITATGDFHQTNTCGSSVEPGGNCTITVTFLPQNKDTRTGAVNVADNAPGSPQALTLTGTGTYVDLRPANLNFGSQPVNSTSLPLTVTFTNKGGSTVDIQSISIKGLNAGDFAQTNDCGTGVARGASCSIDVTFTPTANGNRSGDLVIIDDGGGSPQTVGLKGIGTF